MIFKGIVSSVSNNKCRVYIKDIEFESSLLDVSSHLTILINDTVVVAFYDNNMFDGAVIAKL